MLELVLDRGAGVGQARYMTEDLTCVCDGGTHPQQQEVRVQQDDGLVEW
jgi:hypothetical protein